MIRRPGALIAVGIVLALGAAACGTSSNTSTSGSGITFAAPVSQTGAFGQAEGLYTLQGYKFCVQTLNAKGGIQYGGWSHHVPLVAPGAPGPGRSARPRAFTPCRATSSASRR